MTLADVIRADTYCMDEKRENLGSIAEFLVETADNGEIERLLFNEVSSGASQLFGSALFFKTIDEWMKKSGKAKVGETLKKASRSFAEKKGYPEERGMAEFALVSFALSLSVHGAEDEAAACEYLLNRSPESFFEMYEEADAGREFMLLSFVRKSEMFAKAISGSDFLQKLCKKRGGLFSRYRNKVLKAIFSNPFLDPSGLYSLLGKSPKDLREMIAEMSPFSEETAKLFLKKEKSAKVLAFFSINEKVPERFRIEALDAMFGKTKQVGIFEVMSRGFLGSGGRDYYEKLLEAMERMVLYGGNSNSSSEVVEKNLIHSKLVKEEFFLKKLTEIIELYGKDTYHYHYLFNVLAKNPEVPFDLMEKLVLPKSSIDRQFVYYTRASEGYCVKSLEKLVSRNMTAAFYIEKLSLLAPYEKYGKMFVEAVKKTGVPEYAVFKWTARRVDLTKEHGRKALSLMLDMAKKGLPVIINKEPAFAAMKYALNKQNKRRR